MTPSLPSPSQPLPPLAVSNPNRNRLATEEHNPPPKPVMRIVVPLQGIVQGRGGLILGSIIPCALFYFYQLYLKKNRNNSRQRSPPASPSTTSPASSNLASELHRSSSRASLASSRGSQGPCRVSARASSMVSSSDSTYYFGLMKAMEDPYHELNNPNGIIQLGIAENRLSLDLIEKWFARNLEHSLMDGNETGINGIATYQPFDGLMDLKVGLADFMSTVMGKVSFDPSQLVLTCGATPAVEILFFCLADPGNAFLIPSPYYPGFDRDVMRTGVELIPIHCCSSEDFSLSINAVDQAYNQAEKRGLKVRGILLCNPSNPVGNLLPRETLHDLLNFSRDKSIHIISDEIYAGSVFGTAEFVSMAEIIEAEDQDKTRVHIVYGLSKDLSLSGLRVGAIYSFNENVLAAAKRMTRFSSISAPTQRLMISMLSDKRFIQEYMGTNRKRMKTMYDTLVAALRQLGVGCAKSDGGFYCWADMSGFIQPRNKQGEHELWDKMLNVAKVCMASGSACHCIQPGWFRCCFTTLTEKDIPVVVGRIKKVLQICKSST